MALALALFAAFVGPLLVEDAWLRLVVAAGGLIALAVGLRRLRRRYRDGEKGPAEPG
ncbi:MAG TPA: hypothetical protein VFS30_03955 [Dehalococcoidia bacterium]|nr:hypothetical protein [Dehalococcoidia bacterium]